MQEELEKKVLENMRLKLVIRLTLAGLKDDQILDIMTHVDEMVRYAKEGGVWGKRGG